MRQITPNLWFDNQAEEAVKFYVSVFKKSKVTEITHYGKAGAKASGMPEGSVMAIAFELNGKDFVALNGGPAFTFNEAISLIVHCEDQKEVDYYWDRLTEGGDEKAQVCGWLKDRYGLSWQIVPAVLEQMLRDQDQEKVERVMQSMLAMKKLDIGILRQA